jgi:hypothetical protein
VLWSGGGKVTINVNANVIDELGIARVGANAGWAIDAELLFLSGLESRSDRRPGEL